MIDRVENPIRDRHHGYRKSLSLWIVIATLAVSGGVTGADEQSRWNPHGVSKEELAARALACSDPTEYLLRTRITLRSGRTVRVAIEAHNREGPSTPEKICWTLSAVDSAGAILAAQTFRVPTRLTRDEVWRETITFHGIDAASVVRIESQRVFQRVPEANPDELTRSRAKELVEAYIRALDTREAHMLKSLYEEQVAYLAETRISRAAVIAKIAAQFARWENADHTLIGIDEITPTADGFRVRFRMSRWSVDHQGNANATNFIVTQEWRSQHANYQIQSEHRTTMK